MDNNSFEKTFIQMLFAMVNVVIDNFMILFSWLIVAFFVLMSISTLTDHKISFGEFGIVRMDDETEDDATIYTSTRFPNTAQRTFSPNNTRDAYRVPYDDYSVSQGRLHGVTGYLGIDLVGGCGSPIYSPISGIVTMNGFDGYVGSNAEWMPNGVLTTSYGYTYPNDSVKGQNTWIEITGDDGIFRTILFHGIYTPNIGDHVAIGEQIGTENTIGNSTGCHSHVTLYKYGKEISILIPK